jgi:hypothetical protein
MVRDSTPCFTEFAAGISVFWKILLDKAFDRGKVRVLQEKIKKINFSLAKKIWCVYYI